MYEIILPILLTIKIFIQNNFSAAIVSLFVSGLFNLLNEKRARKKENREDKEYKLKEEARIKLEAAEKEKLQKIKEIKEKVEEFEKEYKNNKAKIFDLEITGGRVICEVEKRVKIKFKDKKDDAIWFPKIKLFEIKDTKFLIEDKDGAREFNYEDIEDIEYYWYVLDYNQYDKNLFPRLKFSELIKKQNSKLENGKYDIIFAWPKDINAKIYCNNEHLSCIKKEELNKFKEEEIEVEFLKNLKKQLK